MFIGIDIGTSSVKAVLCDAEGQVLADASASLVVQRPQPGWSEQDPDAWWQATQTALGSLRDADPARMRAVRGLGLSGQMHGATLLDGRDRPLRPAILWNDGRSEPQCQTLMSRVPAATEITANRVMPGFTAPKLLWVAEHEPAIFAAVRRVLLPKDYVRLQLTGTHATDRSDASGTSWLDVPRRAWSDEMLCATGLSARHMPQLHDGSDPTGTLRPSVASELGLSPGVVVAAGAGDNAASAIGMGVLGEGDALVSLGTSGVCFVGRADCRPDPARAVHTYCHALPERFHQMAVLLSAASCLSWLARTFGCDEAGLFEEVRRDAPGPSDVLFLPYLSGERTPHDDPQARGTFVGLHHATGRAQLTRAVLDGVALAFADSVGVLAAAGPLPREMTLVGGGTRSALWGQILASALGTTLRCRAGAAHGAALGAARLGMVAATGCAIGDACPPGAITERHAPQPALHEHYQTELPRFRTLYTRLRGAFQPWSPATGPWSPAAQPRSPTPQPESTP